MLAAENASPSLRPPNPRGLSIGEITSSEAADLDQDGRTDLTYHTRYYGGIGVGIGPWGSPVVINADYTLSIQTKELLTITNQASGTRGFTARLPEGANVPDAAFPGSVWSTSSSAASTVQSRVYRGTLAGRNWTAVTSEFASAAGYVGFRFQSALGMRSAWTRIEAVTNLSDLTATWGYGPTSWEPRRGVPARAGIQGGLPGWKANIREVPLDFNHDGTNDAYWVHAWFAPTNSIFAPGAEHTVSIRRTSSTILFGDQPVADFGGLGAARYEAGQSIGPGSWNPASRNPWQYEFVLIWSGKVSASNDWTDMQGPYANSGGYLPWIRYTLEGEVYGWLEIEPAAIEPGASGFEWHATTPIQAGSPGTPVTREERTPLDLDNTFSSDAEVVRYRMFRTNETGQRLLVSLRFEALDDNQLLMTAPGGPATNLFIGTLRQAIGPTPPAGFQWSGTNRTAWLAQEGSVAPDTTPSTAHWYVPVRIPPPNTVNGWRYGYMVLSTNGELERVAGWATNTATLLDTIPDAAVTLWSIDIDQDGLVDLASYSRRLIESYNDPIGNSPDAPAVPGTDTLVGTGIRSFSTNILSGLQTDFTLTGNPGWPVYVTWFQADSSLPGDMISGEPSFSPIGVPGRRSSNKPAWYFTRARFRRDWYTSFDNITESNPIIPFHFEMADGWHAGWLTTTPKLSWYLHPVAGEAIRAGSRFPASQSSGLWINPSTNAFNLRWFPTNSTVRLESLDPTNRQAVWLPIPGATNGSYTPVLTNRARLYRINPAN
jgi:hypothetical protein